MHFGIPIFDRGSWDYLLKSALLVTSPRAAVTGHIRRIKRAYYGSRASPITEHFMCPLSCTQNPSPINYDRKICGFYFEAESPKRLINNVSRDAALLRAKFTTRDSLATCFFDRDAEL